MRWVRLNIAFEAGDKLPFHQRLVAYPSFVFPIEIRPNSELDVRILVDTGSSMQVPIYLWQPEQFLAAKSKEILVFGLFIGAMLIMAVYNLLLFLSTKVRSYLYFTLTLVFYALVQGDLTGLSYAYLWPDWPQWNDKSMIVVSNLALVSLALFSL